MINRLLNRYTFAFSLWPTLITVIVMVFCTGLCVWQVQRLFWKEGILAEREQRLDAAPIVFQASQSPKLSSQELSHRRVEVTGTFLHDKEITFLGRDAEGRPGYIIMTPLVQDENSPWILVNRGWVSSEERFQSNRPRDLLVKEPVTITGFIHDGFIRNPFTPENDPKAKIWFWTDYGALESQLQHKIEKMIVVADRAQDPMERPKGGQISLDNIPNNHLQYALTWFMMALTSFIVWFIYHLKPKNNTDNTLKT